MRAKEFGSWNKGDTNGGFHDYGDGFNRALKGQPYTRPKEYASSDLDEYHDYPEFKDLEKEQEEKKKENSQNSDQPGKKDLKNSKIKNTAKTTRNLVGRFVAIAAGTVVLANTNPVLAERFPFLQVSSIFQIEESTAQEEVVDPDAGITKTWTWSADLSSVTLEITDQNGNTKELPATVSTSTTDPTCTAEGRIIHTATAVDGEETYTETKEETTDPLGHEFGEAKTVVQEDGKTEVLFECTRCHEQFKISTSVDEE